MNLLEIYFASLRQDDLRNQADQNHHPHPQQVEMKPSLWQRLRIREEYSQEALTARVRIAS